MQYCIVEIHSQTASFRNPSFQNYHKTFDLPPPTVLIGLLGAALGLSAPGAQNFVEECDLQIGIAGQSAGKARDTWKYISKIENAHCYDSNLDGSIITREILVHNHFFLVYGTTSATHFDKIHTAFLAPKYALTMGNSDALAFVKSVKVHSKISKQRDLSHCVLAGDVVGEVLDRAAADFEFSIYESSDSITYDLPTRFDYADDYGKRKVAQVAPFSFIAHQMKLNFEIKGVGIEGRFIPVFGF